MKRLFLPLFLCMSALSLCAQSFYTVPIEQRSVTIGPTPNGLYAQVFTSAATAQLGNVDLYYQNPGTFATTTFSVQLGLYPVAGDGLPDLNTVLATSSITVDQSAPWTPRTYGTITFDFSSQNASLLSGVDYALGWTLTDGFTNFFGQSANLSPSKTYEFAFGQWNPAAYDFSMDARVATVVPEPATYGLLAGALGLALAFRRRVRR